MGFESSARSELKDAAIAAGHFNTNHHEDVVRRENMRELENMFYSFDEPLGDSSIIPTFLISGIARKYTKVALSGDGGDELFGGYEWYTQLMHFKKISKIMFFTGAKDKFNRYRQLTSPRFTVEELKKMFPHAKNEDFPETESYLYRKHYKKDLSEYKRWQYIDAMTFMTDDILTKVDRASMAHSLEVRPPFLDHRIAEFAFSLPDDLCFRRGLKKYLLKKAIKDKVPAVILNKSKQGFSCPVNDYWTLSAMKSEIRKGLLRKSHIMDSIQTEKMLLSKDMPHTDAKIWLIAVLEKWFNKWYLGN